MRGAVFLPCCLTWCQTIKKRWQRIHRRIIQKYFHDSDYQDGVITHLEPNNLDCELKWTLGSITQNKASEGYGTPGELFQILKDDTVIVLNSVCWANLENSAVDTRL